MDIPAWHETSIPASDVVNLRAIAAMPQAPSYDALRSYATGRREHALLGPMPGPVARIANRRLWLKADITAWLLCPIPPWQRTARAVAAWIAEGRPRGAGRTLSGGGPRPTAS